MNKETLEEAAKKYCCINLSTDIKKEIAEGRDIDKYDHYDTFIAGAECQAERMYSEENILDFAEYCLSHADAFNTPKDDLFTKWFEQFKKK